MPIVSTLPHSSLSLPMLNLKRPHAESNPAVFSHSCCDKLWRIAAIGREVDPRSLAAQSDELSPPVTGGHVKS
jgi:hypothetical protein